MNTKVGMCSRIWLKATTKCCAYYWRPQPNAVHIIEGHNQMLCTLLKATTKCCAYYLTIESHNQMLCILCILLKATTKCCAYYWKPQPNAVLIIEGHNQILCISLKATTKCCAYYRKPQPNAVHKLRKRMSVSNTLIRNTSPPTGLATVNLSTPTPKPNCSVAN